MKSLLGVHLGLIFKISLCVILLTGAGCRKRVPVAAAPPPPPPAPTLIYTPAASVPTSAPYILEPPSGPVPEPTPKPPALMALEAAELAFNFADYAAAVPRYEEYLRLAPDGNQRDRALFQLGLIHMLPDYPRRDWEKAAAFLKQLIADYSYSSLKPEAQVILSLRAEVLQFTSDKREQEQRIRQLTIELDGLKRINADRLRR